MSNIIPFKNPIVHTEGNRVFATSRDVAEFFEKRHDHVLRDIDTLIEQGVPNFGEAPYVNAQNGQTYRFFDMDRDGFSLLAMGFTGPKALKFKLAYIKAFNEALKRLEEATRTPAVALPNFSNPAEAARAWADELEGRLLAEDKIIGCTGRASTGPQPKLSYNCRPLG